MTSKGSSRRGWLWLGCLALVWAWTTPAFAVDFIQSYTRGKLLYKQRLYKDAVVEFNKAISQTARGRTHFGAHYYMARALFWLPDIARAMATLDKAKSFIKNAQQRTAYRKALRQIRALYSKVTMVPQVDPDEVGRLQLALRPKSAFSHKHKKRYFRILMKQIEKKGGVAPTASLYLPKGEYEIGLKRDQCLQYGLFVGGKVARELEVGNADQTLNVQGQKSCSCPNNQVVIKNPKNPKRLTCSCPPGSVRDPKTGVCKKAKAQVVWPWITLGVVGGAGVVAAAIIVPIVLSQTPTQRFLTEESSTLW